IKGEPRISSGKRSREEPSLIEPGQMISFPFPYPMEFNLKSTGEVPRAEKNVDIVVTSVAFSDGTYEGDRREVAKYKAFTLGDKIQIKRILEVLRSKFETVDYLRTAISPMSTTVDEAALSDLVTRNSELFPAD